MELTNLQQVSECNVGCCNSAGDMHLKGHTQANQSAFEYRAQNNRTGHCTINSMSLKKLGVFLDHVKAEIFRLDSLNPSGNPRKRIKSPSLQYVPAALSTTNSLTPSKDKLRFPGDQSTGAALQGTQRELFPSGGQVRESSFRITKRRSYESILYLEHFK